MKSLIQALVVAAVLAVPAVSFAQSTQSNQPLTRAEVKAQLIQIEKAGYNPATANDYDYPANIQAAEARVAAQNGGASSYGGVANGTSDSGAAVQSAFGDNVRSVYMGH
ncbi:hypothetical protein EOS_27190 [Caballeronia mineralivorans PML1(12)]|uniref:Purine nucleoside phosphorylase n=1 Tax=Caballeronia mineralivorans PML1(12) TaxID=908627 RepID=A0A0J1FTJ7_9BURK|nr:DUF4148 domain-containing protein [Caballeronia mineralivorans]KLU23108.1 hypothetical protein EOS_27190 [Caballeronia mineralivorans PML1(12)]